MENTLENKQKFFAQYWGQNVLKLSKEISPFVLNDRSRICSESGFLELTPLHLIRDEDAIDVEKIWRNSDFRISEYFKNIKGNEIIIGRNLSIHWDENCKINFENRIDTKTIQYISDYLRSKGYALPYNGLSVQEMIQRGWVVLKTEI